MTEKYLEVLSNIEGSLVTKNESDDIIVDKDGNILYASEKLAGKISKLNQTVQTSRGCFGADVKKDGKIKSKLLCNPQYIEDNIVYLIDVLQSVYDGKASANLIATNADWTTLPFDIQVMFNFTLENLKIYFNDYDTDNGLMFNWQNFTFRTVILTKEIFWLFFSSCWVERSC